jgi:hypothetical protein
MRQSKFPHCEFLVNNLRTGFLVINPHAAILREKYDHPGNFLQPFRSFYPLPG